MKRFMLFAYDRYDRNGGLNDLVATFNTLVELLERVRAGFAFRDSTQRTACLATLPAGCVPSEQLVIVQAYELQVYDAETTKITTVTVSDFVAFEDVLTELRERTMESMRQHMAAFFAT